MSSLNRRGDDEGVFGWPHVQLLLFMRTEAMADVGVMKTGWQAESADVLEKYVRLALASGDGGIDVLLTRRCWQGGGGENYFRRTLNSRVVRTDITQTRAASKKLKKFFVAPLKFPEMRPLYNIGV